MSAGTGYHFSYHLAVVSSLIFFIVCYTYRPTFDTYELFEFKNQTKFNFVRNEEAIYNKLLEEVRTRRNKHDCRRLFTTKNLYDSMNFNQNNEQDEGNQQIPFFMSDYKDLAASVPSGLTDAKLPLSQSRLKQVSSTNL